MPKGKRHSAQFKFKVALEAAKGTKTLAELASQYGLHPSQISEWKQQLHTHTPFYGWPRMTAHLRRHGYAINHKRVQRLMRLMGLRAIYPKHRTSVAAKGHEVYPYLLRSLAITRCNQVWSADVTYVTDVFNVILFSVF